MHKFITFLTRPGLQLEGLWLHLLPFLIRDYRWVEVHGFRCMGLPTNTDGCIDCSRARLSRIPSSYLSKP